ncbi:neurofilament light polypeptide-like isoform X2 [Paralichthys olivaceus]|uniref:neurofilament light polypeptide-like isoform X2 n=1 Tax=Paralichthys olivaceus TaxID=8255 RepID=UPI0037533157
MAETEVSTGLHKVGETMCGDGTSPGSAVQFFDCAAAREKIFYCSCQQDNMSGNGKQEKPERAPEEQEETSGTSESDGEEGTGEKGKKKGHSHGRGQGGEKGKGKGKGEEKSKGHGGGRPQK